MKNKKKKDFRRILDRIWLLLIIPDAILTIKPSSQMTIMTKSTDINIRVPSKRIRKKGE